MKKKTHKKIMSQLDPNLKKNNNFKGTTPHFAIVKVQDFERKRRKEFISKYAGQDLNLEEMTNIRINIKK